MRVPALRRFNMQRNTEGFRDIKSSLQNNAVILRSKKVELIYQEVWGLLLAYNVVRQEASRGKGAMEDGE